MRKAIKFLALLWLVLLGVSGLWSGSAPASAGQNRYSDDFLTGSRAVGGLLRTSIGLADFALPANRNPLPAANHRRCGHLFAPVRACTYEGKAFPKYSSPESRCGHWGIDLVSDRRKSCGPQLTVDPGASLRRAITFRETRSAIATNTGGDSMAGVRAAGAEGESAAGIVKNSQRIPAPSGGAAYRIPGELGNGILGEVKNVKSLSYTSQLQDFMSYA